MFLDYSAIQELNKRLNNSLKSEGLAVHLQQPGKAVLQIKLEGKLNDRTTIRICEFFENLLPFKNSQKNLRIIFDTSGVEDVGENSRLLLLDKMKSLAVREIFSEISIILNDWWWRVKARIVLLAAGKSTLKVYKNLQEALRDAEATTINNQFKFDLQGAKKEDYFQYLNTIDFKKIESNEEWSFLDEEDDFECQFHIINKQIITGFVRGNISSVQATALIRCKQEAAKKLKAEMKYVIVDLSEIKYISKDARKLILQFEKDFLLRFDRTFWIIEGYAKTIFNAYKLTQGDLFKSLRLVKSFEEAYSKIGAAESFSSEINQTKNSIESDLDKKIAALAKAINLSTWNESLHKELNLEEDDPFNLLFEGIKVLKSDMDDAYQKALYTNLTLENQVDEHTQEITTKETNLRSILDNTDDEIYLINNRYELIDYNNNFENNFYARYGVFVEKGRNIFSMMPPEYADLANKMKDRIDKTLLGQQRTYYDKLNLGFYESISEIKFFPIRSSTRIVSGVSIFVRDCTEQKKSEDIIHQNQLLLSSINRNIKEGLYRSTPSRGMIYVNQAFVEMFGFASESEALEAPSGSLYDDADGRNRLIRLIEEYGSFNNEEVRFKKKDGTPFWGLISSMRSIDPEGNVYYDGAIRDITHIKEYEKEILKSKEIAESATRAKSDFLATMSHEIRTPMNGVIGMTSLLADTKLTSQQKDFVETIKVSGEHLLNIINDILDFSKIEAGALELENSVFDLNTCIEEVMNLFSGRAYEKQIELFYRVTNSEVLQLRGDVTRLRQVIVNLIGNAIKFTEKGEVIIDVEVGSRKKGKIELTLSVIDTGIGIPKEKLSKLFKPFSQVDNSTTRKYGGTGLGLAISQRLVSLMGGDLQVESITGKGTRFFFTLNLEESKLEEKKTHNVEMLQGKRIIIVDDNRTNRLILEQLFTKNGMKVESFDSPTIALNILSQSKKYDLGLIDMKMPEMDGIEFAKKLLRQNSANELPLILYSSIGHMLSRAEINKYFKAHVSKPIRHDILLKKMSEILSDNGVANIQEEAIKKGEINNIANEYPLNILLAEDNLINQKLAEQVLGMFGYRITIVDNGQKAVNTISHEQFDLVFMDVMMPEMDGLEATRNIRKLNIKEQPIIIAMTANALKGDREKCIDSGMNDYVSKPIDVNQVGNLLIQYGKKIKDKKH